MGMGMGMGSYGADDAVAADDASPVASRIGAVVMVEEKSRIDRIDPENAAAASEPAAAIVTSPSAALSPGMELIRMRLRSFSTPSQKYRMLCCWLSFAQTRSCSSTNRAEAQTCGLCPFRYASCLALMHCTARCFTHSLYPVFLLSLVQRAALKNFSASDSDESPRVGTLQAGGAMPKVPGANVRKQAADDDEFDLPGL